MGELCLFAGCVAAVAERARGVFPLKHGDASIMKSHFILPTLPSVLTASHNNPQSNNPSKRINKFIVVSDIHIEGAFTFENLLLGWNGNLFPYFHDSSYHRRLALYN